MNVRALLGLIAFLASCGRFGFDPSATGTVIDGDTTDSPAFREDGGVDPTCTAPLTPSQVVVAREHVCALSGANLYCWGANGRGQLGIGDNTDRGTPTQLAGINWSSVSAFDSHTCGFAATALSCWGANDYGQLGFGDTMDRNLATLLTSAFTSISAGGEHTCGISGGEMQCWGKNDRGQLGLGDQMSRNTPASLPAHTWIEIHAGASHTCAVTQDALPRTLTCWGANDHGQINGGNFDDSLVPRGAGCCDYLPVLGATHTLAIHAGPNLQVWGGNSDGQLGLGDTADRNLPANGTGVWGLPAAGERHSCGIKPSTGLFCWGANDRGQLGLGSAGSDVLTPTQVGTDVDWATVKAGGSTTCATKMDGRLFCWGANDRGQLGLGHLAPRSRPTQVCLGE